jgi:hypothetical protein
MACPYFFPERPLEGPRPARAPLGDVFGGTCCLSGTAPERTSLVDLCNFGYARGRCSLYPSDAACDALRFTARHSDETLVEVTFVREKDWTPVESGRVTYLRSEGALTPEPADEALARQTKAFAARCPAA